jgi:hypothetical protein
MICALFFLFACDRGLVSETEVEPKSAVAAAGTLRNCLKVASGLKDAGDRNAAAEHVLGCYEKHFAPMKPVLRAQNQKAALSLEYGFGLLAQEMRERRVDGGSQADQLSDRVEAVLASIQNVQTEKTE